jgi:hypothetical protein
MADEDKNMLKAAFERQPEDLYWMWPELGRWDILEDLTKTTPNAAALYANRVIKGPWLEAESLISTEGVASARYGADAKNERFPAGEPAILKDFGEIKSIEDSGAREKIEVIGKYFEKHVKARWQEFENMLVSVGSEHLATSGLSYAKAFKVKSPELESLFAKYPMSAYNYARHVTEERFPAGEAQILTNPEVAAAYAMEVMEARWPEAENVIATDLRAKSQYEQAFPRG